jgi:HrpA-like RNA helicase
MCRIRRKRKDLRIIISSATIDAAMFRTFFDAHSTPETAEANKAGITSVISLEGRIYPVDVMYLDEPCEDYIEISIKTVLDIHLKVLSPASSSNVRNPKEIFYYSSPEEMRSNDASQKSKIDSPN